MFDINLFVNKKYSVHTHCSLLCSNNKLLLQFRVSARIEEPVNSAQKINTCACAHTPQPPIPQPPSPGLLQVRLSVWRCFCCCFLFVWLGPLLGVWRIASALVHPCGDALLCHIWMPPVGGEFETSPICCDVAHLWIYNGSMRREKGAFKANASLSKIFFFPTLCRRDMASWVYNFYF